jgi:hypothetical protein
MSIRPKYIEALSILERTSPIKYYDNKQLTDMAHGSRLRSKFNICNSYDLFRPDHLKPYSILNTDDSSSGGIHWVSVYQDGPYMLVYDSFARTSKLMKPFVQMMKKQGFEVVFVNRGKDQSDEQLNCGLRSLLWLIFVDKYGIKKSLSI